MHIKVASADSWDLGDVTTQLVKRSSRGIIGDDYKCLVKRAGEEFANAIKGVSFEKDETPVHVIAMGCHEKYGCFFEGAGVHTITGIKPIEAVSVGDLVLTHRNRYCPVTNTFESDYSGIRTEIVCYGLPDAIISTGAHPHCVIPQDACTGRIRFEQRKAGTLSAYLDALVANAKYTEAQHVLPGDYLVIPCCPTAVETVDLPESADPYVLGVYVAEGCLVKKRKENNKYHKLLFVLDDADENIIAYLQNWHRVAIQPSRTSEHSCRLDIGDMALAAVIDKLFGHTAHTKHIHPAVFSWSKESKLRFLAGYFDGDGCLITKNKYERYIGTLTASTVSKSLALDVQRLCANVGVAASVSRCHNYEHNRTKYEGFGKGRGDLPIFSISIGARDSNLILQYCLRLQAHSRQIKYGGSHVHTSGQYLLTPVRAVTQTHVEDVTRYNLAVSSDNTFVVDVLTHNSNRNSDTFGSICLDKYHPTFVKYAKVYRHHINKDPKKSYGVVKASAFNKDMGRVELLLGLNENKEAAERNEGLVADKELQKLNKGEDLAVSMSCKVAYDVCMGCNNKARSRAEYCTEDTCKYGGCKDNLGKVAEDGFVLCVDNPHPTFFDISSVYRPADRIAYGNVADYLQKSASHKTISGAEWAEIYGSVPPVDLLVADVHDLRTMSQVKLAYMLAEIEDEIEREKPKWAQDIGRAFSNKPVDTFDFNKLASYQPAVVLNELWQSQDILLPPQDFVSLVLGDGGEKSAAVAADVMDLLPGIYNRLIVSDDLVGQIRDHAKFAQQRLATVSLRQLAEKSAESRSVDHTHLQRRIWQSAIHNLSTPMLLQRQIEKYAETGLAFELARRYALYKLACLQKYSGTDKLPLTCKAAIVQNYISY